MAEIELAVINSEKYFQGILKILKNTGKNKSIIYVTTNKPYKYVVASAKKAGVMLSKLFVIDCISHSLNSQEKEPENCVFLESPEGLTSISLAISESVKLLAGEKILLLDSLSTLLIYNDSNTVGKFSNFVINKLRTSDVGAIIFALESDLDKDILKQVEALADKVKKY